LLLGGWVDTDDNYVSDVSKEVTTIKLRQRNDSSYIIITFGSFGNPLK